MNQDISIYLFWVQFLVNIFTIQLEFFDLKKRISLQTTCDTKLVRWVIINSPWTRKIITTWRDEIKCDYLTFRKAVSPFPPYCVFCEKYIGCLFDFCTSLMEELIFLHQNLRKDFLLNHKENLSLMCLRLSAFKHYLNVFAFQDP